MKAEAAALERFKLSIRFGGINQKVAASPHIPRHGNFPGCAGDWVRLRGLSFARSTRSAVAIVDLCRNAGVRLGGRYRNRFSHPGAAGKYSEARRRDLHSL